jgi:hypothetical protein
LTFIIELNRYSALNPAGGSSSGRTQGSEPCYPGSNPGPPAIFCLVEKHPWSHRLVVRTLASHAGNRGSSPRGTTKRKSISYEYFNILQPGLGIQRALLSILFLISAVFFKSFPYPNKYFVLMILLFAGRLISIPSRPISIGPL